MVHVRIHFLVIVLPVQALEFAAPLFGAAGRISLLPPQPLKTRLRAMQSQVKPFMHKKFVIGFE